jgi:hypothetical protein
MTLFAHHLEMHHLPVLMSLFAAGFFVGWQLVRQTVVGKRKE